VRKVIIGQKLTNQALAMPRPSCKLPRLLVRVRGGFGITSATTVRPGYLGGMQVSAMRQLADGRFDAQAAPVMTTAEARCRHKLADGFYPTSFAIVGQLPCGNHLECSCRVAGRLSFEVIQQISTALQSTLNGQMRAALAIRRPVPVLPSRVVDARNLASSSRAGVSSGMLILGVSPFLSCGPMATG